MCINWIKNLFKPAEPKEETGVTETVPVVVTGTAEDTQITEPALGEPMGKPYEGVDFHVLLDNGHASTTPGKRQQLENGTYFYEWKFNREIVGRIADRLDDLGIPCEILVPEDDVDVALSTRAARANSFCTKYGKDRCFLISVHSNAYGDGVNFTDAKGWSIWTTKGQTKSDEYATIIFNEAERILKNHDMTTRKEMVDGDPDYEENFTVIYKAWCPAVLTENMFFTNRKEVHWLMSDEGKDAIADIHVEGIKRILESL